MDRIVTLETVVRPIRKLYVIEPGDMRAFVNFVELSSGDVNGLANLILLNDEKLFDDNVVAFVKRHDPDVIVNYSACNDANLYDCFRSPVYNKRSSKFIPRRYHTPLAFFQNPPPIVLAQYKLAGEPFVVKDKVWSVIYKPSKKKGSKREKTPDAEELFLSVHCGRVDAELREELTLSLFKKTVIEPIRTPKQFSSVISEYDNNFLYLPLPFAGGSRGWSVYEMNYNPNHYFSNKPTLIFGRFDDLASIIYFWNTRATYPYNKTVWMPVELIERYRELLDSYEHYCVFTEDAREHPILKPLLEKMVELDCSKYYFGTIEHWGNYKSVQNVPIVNNHLKINHPQDKLFSDPGQGNHCMLEIRGLEQSRLPTSHALGELFVEERNKPELSYLLSRISHNGLSVGASDFSSISEEALFVEIILPDEKTVFHTLFNDFALELSETASSRVIRQLVNLVDGIENLTTIVDPGIFELLVKLTPRRISRIVKELSKELAPEMAEERIYEMLRRNLEGLTVISSNVTVAASDLPSLVPRQSTDRHKFFGLIQKLYEKRILLRGKSFKCPFCEGELWLPLEIIKEDNKCYRCNQNVHLPVYYKGETLNDSFRLNELVSNAVDQGVLPVLLALSFLNQQRFFGKKFLYDCEVRSTSDNTLLAEVDLLFILGKRVGLGEVKADRGFDLAQVDRLISVAEGVQADMLLFATLKKKETDEVSSLQDHLSARQLNIPAFILPHEALFSPEEINMSGHFEVDRESNKFRVGPIVLG